MLTNRESQLLIFIRQHLETTGGVAPSYDEMVEALGVASKSGIHRLITALEERGFIRRLPHRARAIEVLDPLPADTREAMRGVLVEVRSMVTLEEEATPAFRQRCVARIDRLMERLENREC